jgi:hypothetical protein
MITQKNASSCRLFVTPPDKLRTVSQSSTNHKTCDICSHANFKDRAVLGQVASFHVGQKDSRHSGHLSFFYARERIERIALFG